MSQPPEDPYQQQPGQPPQDPYQQPGWPQQGQPPCNPLGGQLSSAGPPQGQAASHPGGKTTTKSREIFGWLLLAAAAITLVSAYGTLLSPSACPATNQINQQFGGGATCSSSPSAGYYAAAAFLAAAGLLMLAPWILRFITGKDAL